MIDLFTTPEVLPTEIQAILNKYESCDATYDTCEELVKELELHGYTCEYGLDGTPFNLQKI